MSYLVKAQMRQFGRGWEYSFYVNAGSARDACQVLIGIKSQLIRVHDVGTYLESVTAANTEARETWKEFVKQNPAAVGSNFAADADVVSTAARVRLFSSTNKSRYLWLRGLADSAIVVNASGLDTPAPVWSTRLNALLLALGGQASPFLIRTRKPATGNNRPISVVSIAPETGSDNRNSVFTLREEPPFAAGDRVDFRFDRSDVFLLPYEGSHKVLSVDVGNKKFTVNASFLGQDAAYIPFGMSARWEDFDEVSISGGQFVNFGERQTGVAKGPKGKAKGTSFRHVR